MIPGTSSRKNHQNLLKKNWNQLLPPEPRSSNNHGNHLNILLNIYNVELHPKASGTTSSMSTARGTPPRTTEEILNPFFYVPQGLYLQVPLGHFLHKNVLKRTHLSSPTSSKPPERFNSPQLRGAQVLRSCSTRTTPAATGISRVLGEAPRTSSSPLHLLDCKLI